MHKSSSDILDWFHGSMPCNVYFPMVSSGRTSQWRQPNCIDPHRQHPLQSSMSYGRNYSFGENAITKCGGPPFGCAAFEYGLWGIGFGRSPIGYEGSLNRFKVQGNFLLLYLSTNFVGYYIACSFPSGLGLGQNLPKLTQVDSVPRQAAVNVQVHTHRIIE